MNKKIAQINGRALDVLVSVCTVGWIPIASPEYPVLAFVGCSLQFYCYFVIKIFAVERFNENIEWEPWWVKTQRFITNRFVKLSQKFLWKIVQYLPIPLLLVTSRLMEGKQKYISWLVIAFIYTCTGGAVVFHEKKEAKNDLSKMQK